jgi:outer membrane protein assembly factor BamE (lipoprotein component of BamABCDE complex)
MICLVVARRVASTLLLAALAACASLGNGQAFQQSDADRAQALRPGVTTRDDVRRALGEASVYQFDNGFEAWTYQSTSGVPHWVRYLPYLGLLPLDGFSHTKELALLFDRQGVLRKAEWHVAAGGAT